MNMEESLAIHARNLAWRDDPRIPPWVDTECVGLDQFFTRRDVAAECHRSLLEWMRLDGADEANYQFIEPTAGTEVFFDLLPRNR